MVFGWGSSKPVAPVAPAVPSFEDQIPTVIPELLHLFFKGYFFFSYENFFVNIIV
jgi:hypothetical protein